MLMSTLKPLGELENPSEFIARHIGISAADEQHMLSVIGEASRRALIESIVPRSIARAQAMQLPAPGLEEFQHRIEIGNRPHSSSHVKPAPRKPPAPIARLPPIGKRHNIRLPPRPAA